jgi:phage shock protein E
MIYSLNLIRPISLLMLCLLLASSCQNSGQKNQQTTTNTQTTSKGAAAVQTPIRNISANYLEKMGIPENGLLIDVRSPEEYADGHLKDAVSINVEAPEFDQQIAKLDKNKVIIVYCASGTRSMEAAERLQKNGFGQVLNLEQGYDDWVKQGKPVVK